MPVTTEYVRKGATIRNLESDEVTTHPSINAAKRASRELQKGALGLGRVRVLAHKQTPHPTPAKKKRAASSMRATIAAEIVGG
jgi:phage terminase small subunit